MAIIIDAYSHFLYPKYLKEASKYSNPSIERSLRRSPVFISQRPFTADVDKRVRVLDKYGIDYQVIMPEPAIDPSILQPRASFREVIRLDRLVNDYMTDAFAKSGGRLIPTGVAPLLEGKNMEDLAVEEIRRSVKDVGIKGFMVPSNVNGKPIDSFSYFWETVDRLGVPVFIHPVNTHGTQNRPYENEYDMMHVFGWPFETTLMFSRLVLSGRMEKNPTLKIVAHHLGAMIPFFAGRIVESYRSERSYRPELVKHLAKQPLAYFKMFYYDTAVGGSVETIRLGYKVFGANHLLFATDFPYGPQGGQKRLKTYPDLIRELGLSRNEEKKIFEGNLRRILRTK